MEVIAKRAEGKRAAAGDLLGLEVRMDVEPLTAAVGAASLCDYVSRALLVHTSESIMRGNRPEGGRQKPLDQDGQQGERARRGERPNVRASTGTPGNLPANLTRSQVRSTGGLVRIGRGGQLGYTAHATITVGNVLQNRFLAEEDAMGIEYFSVEGAADRVIEDVVIDYLATVFDGVRHYDGSKVKAHQAR